MVSWDYIHVLALIAALLHQEQLQLAAVVGSWISWSQWIGDKDASWEFNVFDW